jgi:hypothetical protein
MTVEVTGVRLIGAKPYHDKSRLVAMFDCNVNGIAMRECLLIRRANGKLRVFPPKVDSRGDGSRQVSFIDVDLAVAVTNAAHEKYLLIGGVEAA